MAPFDDLVDRAGFRVELELRLDADRQGDQLRLNVRLRCFRGHQGGPICNHTGMLDLAELRAHEDDREAYGQALGRAVWAEPDAAAALDGVRAAAGREDRPVHLMFFLQDSAELYGIRWERLVDHKLRPLALGRKVHMSRFYACDPESYGSGDERALTRAVVAVASPEELDADKFPPIDAGRFAREAAELLRMVEVETLGVDRAATIRQIKEALRTETDLFLLVCHGTVGPQGPRLWLGLEDGAANKPALVEPDAVLAAIAAGSVPWLVIVGSCHSSTGSDPGASLAPVLVRAGVPYVLAMHGTLSPETLSKIISELFRSLAESGDLFTGLHSAREQLHLAGTDWSVPVLYTSATDHVPIRVQGPSKPYDRDAISLRVRAALERGVCLPVVGWGVHGQKCISRDAVLERLVRSGSLPAGPTRGRFADALRRLVARLGRPAATNALLKVISELRQEPQGPEPARAAGQLSGPESVQPGPRGLLQQIAALPVPVFLTLDWFDTLSEAVRAQGKVPRVEYVRWNEADRLGPTVAQEQPEYTPTVQEPLILHLFGRWATESSLVLTDDDYFDFARALGEDRDLVPSVLMERLPGSLLLLCEADPEEPDVRLLVNLYARGTRDWRTDQDRHVAIQLDDTGRSPDERPRTEELVGNYFKGTPATVIWGSLARFLEELITERDHASE